MLDSNYLSRVYMACVTLNAWLRLPALRRRRPSLLACHLIFTRSLVSLCSFAEMNLIHGGSGRCAPDTLPRVRVHAVFSSMLPARSFL